MFVISKTLFLLFLRSSKPMIFENRLYSVYRYRLYSDHEIKNPRMARVRVLTMKFPRVTKIGQSIASMRTTPQVSGLGPVTVYIARFKCRAGLDPDRAYLFQLGSAHMKVAPGRARSTRLHCHLFCRAVLDPGRALSICGSVNVAYVSLFS